MALAPGTRLGPYEILQLAGHGGMGEVYAARDTRLGRRVAIKVATGTLLGNAEAERRFDEEMRLAALLDHPRICVVHDVGQSDGVCYFVMEFLEGETLAARLAQGPLPMPELLEYAVQIAAALAHAHRHHVLHRDVKPGNVFLTSSGVKVLDFGLAKVREGLSGATTSELAMLETRPLPLTRPGLVHGTPEYFAPERLEGREGDERSDIFAFGALLYEMATGRRAFDATTPAALISAIMTSDPPPITGDDRVTPELEWVVRRCLKKDPAARWESMSDVEAVLKWLASRAPTQATGVERGSELSAPESGRSGSGAARLQRRPLRMRAAAILACGLLCTALGALTWTWWSAGPPASPSPPVVRFTLLIEPVPTTDFGSYLGSRLTISRDGRRLAYISRRAIDKLPSVFVRQLTSPSTQMVEGTEGATGVFFSPDGQQIGFFADGKMKRVSVGGGAVLTICPVPQAAGASWGDDDTIVFAPSRLSVLLRVSSRGGTPTTLTTFRAGEVSHRFPDFLPGGTAIVYAVAGSEDFTWARIVVESLLTGERTESFEGTYPRYVWNGHIVFAREASLFALPFNPTRLRRERAPEPLVTNLRMNQRTGAALFAVSDSTLIYRAVGAPSVSRVLVWVDMSGREEIIPLEAGPFLQPRLSPDGTRVALTVGDRPEDRDLWTYDFARRDLKRLTVEAGEEETPVWSPDSQQVAFSTERAGQPRMVVTMPADGGTSPTPLGSGKYMMHVSDWSPDGRQLAWTEFHPVAGGQIRVATLDGSGAVRTLVAGPFDARGTVFSPDGRWMAFTSNETGRDAVYVQPYPGPGPKHRISVEVGREPVWSRNGHRVYFRAEGRMSAVDVQTSPIFTAGTPRVLFTDPYEGAHGGGGDRGDRNYDLSADGERFLMMKAARPYSPAELIVTLNWRTALGGRE